MRLSSTILAIVLLGLLGIPAAVWGQQGGSLSRGPTALFGGGSGSFGGSSPFGSSSGSMSQAGGMGGSAQGGFGGQSGGFGQSGFGQGGSGQSGFGQSGFGQGYGTAGQAGSFIGVSAEQMTGRNFIGVAPTTGVAGMQGMQGMGGTSMGRGLQAGQRRAGQAGGMYGGGMNRGQGQVNRPMIRTTLTADITRPASDPQKLSSSLAQQLEKMPALRWTTPAQVEFRGRTAILRGVVATQHDRDLAARVARLDPAVDQVQNDLTVAASSATSTKAAEPATGSPAASRSDSVE